MLTYSRPTATTARASSGGLPSAAPRSPGCRMISNTPVISRFPPKNTASCARFRSPPPGGFRTGSCTSRWSRCSRRIWIMVIIRRFTAWAFRPRRAGARCCCAGWRARPRRRCGCVSRATARCAFPIPCRGGWRTRASTPCARCVSRRTRCLKRASPSASGARRRPRFKPRSARSRRRRTRSPRCPRSSRRKPVWTAATWPRRWRSSRRWCSPPPRRRWATSRC